MDLFGALAYHVHRSESVFIWIRPAQPARLHASNDYHDTTDDLSQANRYYIHQTPWSSFWYDPSHDPTAIFFVALDKDLRSSISRYAYRIFRLCTNYAIVESGDQDQPVHIASENQSCVTLPNRPSSNAWTSSWSKYPSKRKGSSWTERLKTSLINSCTYTRDSLQLARGFMQTDWIQLADHLPSINNSKYVVRNWTSLQWLDDIISTVVITWFTYTFVIRSVIEHSHTNPARSCQHKRMIQGAQLCVQLRFEYPSLPSHPTL